MISRSLISSLTLSEILRFAVEDLSNRSRSQEILDLREDVLKVSGGNCVPRQVENDMHGTRYWSETRGLRPSTFQTYEMPHTADATFCVRLMFNEHYLRRIRGSGSHFADGVTSIHRSDTVHLTTGGIAGQRNVYIEHCGLIYGLLTSTHDRVHLSVVLRPAFSPLPSTEQGSS